jgi:hypothetical protein
MKPTSRTLLPPLDQRGPVFEFLRPRVANFPAFRLCGIQSRVGWQLTSSSAQSFVAAATALLLAAALVLSLSAVNASAAEANSLESVLKSISAEGMQQQINFLADDALEGRGTGSRGGRAAGSYLELQFEKLHLLPAGEKGTFFQEFDAGSRNILATLEGSDPQLKRQYIVVSAHYDHVGYGSPRNSYGPIGYIHHGADDNASGVAGLLALAEALGKLPQHPRRSLLLALWDGEEEGLLGSRHWIKHPTVPLEQVAIAVNMDMIGRLRNQRLDVYGTRTGFNLRRMLSQEGTGLDLLVNFHWDLKPDSDHYSFIEHGIPALLLHTGLHADYHRPSDTADKINSAGMREVTQLALRLVLDLADADQVTGLRKTWHDDGAAAKAALEQAPPPGLGRLGVSWNQADNERGELPGLQLTAVEPNSSAERAGLRAGDRIIRFAQHEIHSAAELRSTVLAAENPVTIVIERQGPDRSEPDRQAPLGQGTESKSRDQQKTSKAQEQALTANLSGEPVRVGLSWQVDDAEPQSVIVVGVVPDSPAERAGIKPTERIYQVDGKDFSSGGEFQSLLLTAPNPLELVVEQQGQIRRIHLVRTGDKTTPGGPADK